MKQLKIALFIIALPLFGFVNTHKFYVSVTKIEYVKEQSSVQIITRIFIDDFEKLLRERYDENITLSTPNELTTVDVFIEQYLREKFSIDINGQPARYTYLGKEYDADIMFCYLEIEGVKDISSFQVSNRVLMDLYEEQENIVRTNIHGKTKSFIFKKGNEQAVLNFN